MVNNKLNMLKKYILILFLILWSQNSSCFLDTLFLVAKEGFMVTKALQLSVANGTSVIDFVSYLDGTAYHKELVQKLDNINNKLEDLQSYTRFKLNDITALINRLPDEIELRSTRKSIIEFILTTNHKWNLFDEYMRNGATKQALSQLAELITYSIGEKLLSFRNSITPLASMDKSTPGFFILMARHALNQIDTLCGTGDTVYHIITRLFPIIIETEIKAYVLQFFAHRFQLFENDGWRTQSIILKREFWEQFKEYTEMYKRSLNDKVFPYIRSCDPVVWQRDETFYELDGLIQQTIYTKPDCHHRGIWDCARLATGEGLPECSIHSMSDHASCGSALLNCREIDHPRMTTEVCLWDSGPYKIRFVTYSGNTHGTDIERSCPSQHQHFFDNLSLNPFAKEVRVCSCQCHAKKWRLFVSQQASNVEDNFVVVGLRFRKEGDIIYIQMAQGHLEKNSRISNFSWVQRREPFEDLIDVTIENAVFYLEDIQLPLAYALIGIGFIRLDSEWPGGFGIQMTGIEVDFELGQIKKYAEYYIWTMRTMPFREERKDYPVKGWNSINMKPYEPSRPISEEYHRVSLRQSDIPHDFGQSTIPLFDAVPVVTNPLAPIGGVGLFLKNQRGYAGFLSLRLFSINYTYYMDTFLHNHNFSSL